MKTETTDERRTRITIETKKRMFRATRKHNPKAIELGYTDEAYLKSFGEKFEE